MAAVLGGRGRDAIICWCLRSRSGERSLVYLGVVALVTWFGGWRPGLLAIGLTSFMCVWIILPPSDSLRLQSWEDGLRLVVFVWSRCSSPISTRRGSGR